MQDFFHQQYEHTFCDKKPQLKDAFGMLVSPFGCRSASWKSFCTYMYTCISGQITILPKPEFRGFFGDSLTFHQSLGGIPNRQRKFFVSKNIHHWLWPQTLPWNIPFSPLKIAKTQKETHLKQPQLLQVRTVSSREGRSVKQTYRFFKDHLS